MLTEKQIEMLEELVRAGIQALMVLSHENAVEKGFWDDPKPIPTDIALMHSELSEMLEGHRTGEESDKLPGFKAEEEEGSDVLIRMGDVAQYHRWDLPNAVVEKLRYNRGRAFMHGGKKY